MRGLVPFAVIAAVLLTGCAPTNSPMGAERAAKRFVSDQLKAPATAKFSSIITIQDSSRPGTYMVTGHVDAQNSYGALIRNSFISTVVYSAPRDDFDNEATSLFAP